MRPPQPPPNVPGETEAERMKNAVRIMFNVPKGAYLKEEARLKRARVRKRASRKSGPKEDLLTRSYLDWLHENGLKLSPASHPRVTIEGGRICIRGIGLVPIFDTNS
jgi:hypothetical protein